MLPISVLETAFASLTSETRATIIEEMERAINDTAVEYHRSEGDIAKDLFGEMKDIRSVLDVVLEAQRQFDELSINGGSDGKPNELEERQDDRSSGR